MHRWFFVLGVLLILGACRSSTEPEPVPSGEVAALLSGAVDASFSAVGPVPQGGELSSFASARPGALAGAFGIMGIRAHSGLHDALLLDLYGVTGPGVYPARGSFLYGFEGPSFESWAGGRRFNITAGEIQIASVSEGRIRGEFSATAVEAISRFPPVAPPDTLQIRNGLFDVPIVRFAR
jgi:hypothetical protein